MGGVFAPCPWIPIPILFQSPSIGGGLQAAQATFTRPQAIAAAVAAQSAPIDLGRIFPIVIIVACIVANLVFVLGVGQCGFHFATLKIVLPIQIGAPATAFALVAAIFDIVGVIGVFMRRVHQGSGETVGLVGCVQAFEHQRLCQALFFDPLA